MKRITPFAIASVLAVLGAIGSSHVRAQERNVDEVTYMTFSGSVELPGVTLEPGTYVFRLADTPSRNVVQVLRKDNREPIGQWNFVPAERPKVTDDTVVMFRETAAGNAPAVQYWFFPAEKVGKEFVYPKRQAERIAARTGQTVQSDEGPVTQESALAANPSASDDARAERSSVASSSTSSERRDASESGVPPARAPARDSRNLDQQDLPVNDPAAADNANNSAAAARTDAAPSRDSKDLDQQEPAGPASAARPDADIAPLGDVDRAQRTDSARQVARAEELPRTASPLPLSGMIGAMSLVAAGLLRMMRQL